MMTHPISLTIPAYVQKNAENPLPNAMQKHVTRKRPDFIAFLLNHPSCLCNLIAAHSGIISFKAVRACGKNEG
jgi:hypothetical protein